MVTDIDPRIGQNDNDPIPFNKLYPNDEIRRKKPGRMKIIYELNVHSYEFLRFKMKVT